MNADSVMWCVSSNTAMNACTAARSTSQLSMIVRRENRSATTPPASVNTTRAIVNDASTPPSAVAEPWIESTANVSATGTIASPIADDDAAEPEQPEAALAQRACGFAQAAHRR